MLDVEYDHGFFFLCCQLIVIIPFSGSLLSFENIHKRAFYDLNDGFVQLKSILELDLYTFVVVAINKLVEGLKLLWISIAHPFSYLSQLCPDRTLLIPVEPLDLDIALIS